MLISYLERVRLILADIGFVRYNDYDLISFLNTARGQIAGEAECVRVYGTLAVDQTTQQYPFTQIVFQTGTVGVQGVINVRMVSYIFPGFVANGGYLVTPREWEFFNAFVLAQPVPLDSSGNPIGSAPSVWAQFGQGVNGTLFINQLDQAYTLHCDTVCYPKDLASDSDVEAIPPFWTDAVPYFAAYIALLTAQNMEAADNMLKLYKVFADRARGFATPSVLPHQYEGSPNPLMANQLGIGTRAQ